MKRAVATVVGALLLLAGVAALVLPGPGMVLCAAGLGVPATQYAWARRSVDWARGRAQEGVERTGSSRFLTLASIACGLVLIAAGIIEFVVDLPLMNIVTAVLVIAGGLFLVVSSWWARRQQVHR